MVLGVRVRRGNQGCLIGLSLPRCSVLVAVEGSPGMRADGYPAPIEAICARLPREGGSWLPDPRRPLHDHWEAITEGRRAVWRKRLRGVESVFFPATEREDDIPPVIIAAVIGAAVSATQLGLQASGAFTPDSPKAPKPGATPLTATQNQQQQALVGQQLPNLQSLTGGSLSPEYYAQFGGQQSGLGNDPQASGNIQAAVNQLFGISAPGTTGFTPSSSGITGGGGPGIMDLITKPPGLGTGSGGGSSFVNDQLSGDLFKGLVS